MRSCLRSEDYMQIKNALLLLNRCVKVIELGAGATWRCYFENSAGRVYTSCIFMHRPRFARSTPRARATRARCSRWSAPFATTTRGRT